MNALALTECVRPNPGDMSTLAPTYLPNSSSECIPKSLSTPSFLSISSCFALRAHSQFLFFLIVNTMAISKQRSEKYYSPPLMMHHPRLYEVPEHPVPAVLAQSRRETIPIHDDTGAGTSFSAHHGTKTLRTNVSEMKALLTYEMVGTQGALTPQIHWVLIHPNCLLEDRTTPLRCASLLLWVLLISYPSYRLT